jgi:hypothetical protein
VSRIRKAYSNTQSLSSYLPLILVVARIARAVPSGVPLTNYRGTIQVQQASDNTVLGYISATSLNSAQLAYDPASANALIVDFAVPTSATVTTQVEISTEVTHTDVSRISRYGILILPSF